MCPRYFRPETLPSWRIALPNGAAARLGRYLDAVDAAVPGLIVGLHVTGSLALGDYHPDRSDIDVVVVVAHAPDPSERSLLAEVHRVVATRVDGPYIPIDVIAKPPADIGPVAFHVDGRFEFGDCHEVSPVTWAILAHDAITVRGATPGGARRARRSRGRERVQRREPAELLGRLGARRSPRSSTRPSTTTRSKRTSWSGACSVSRGALRGATGRVVSKRAGGEYVFETFGAEWHDIARLALEARDREIEIVRVGDLRRACAFVMSVARGVTPRTVRVRGRPSPGSPAAVRGVARPCACPPSRDGRR